MDDFPPWRSRMVTGASFTDRPDLMASMMDSGSG